MTAGGLVNTSFISKTSPSTVHGLSCSLCAQMRCSEGGSKQQEPLSVIQQTKEREAIHWMQQSGVMLDQKTLAFSPFFPFVFCWRMSPLDVLSFFLFLLGYEWECIERRAMGGET